jgi:hypothetical protein
MTAISCSGEEGSLGKSSLGPRRGCLELRLKCCKHQGRSCKHFKVLHFFFTRSGIKLHVHYLDSRRRNSSYRNVLGSGISRNEIGKKLKLFINFERAVRRDFSGPYVSRFINLVLSWNPPWFNIFRDCSNFILFLQFWSSECEKRLGCFF